jgi:hypothetical protein
MANRVADIAKDVKTYLTTGFVLLAAWDLTIPSYIEHRDNQRLVRGLAAYLLIQGALNDEDQRLYVGLGDATLPDVADDMTMNLDTKHGRGHSGWQHQFERGGPCAG